ncbi:MAG TPA: tripartite tricarboxylate transporter substrate-binding protein [Beijerinckiaceae bacterium]|nr:tripartite tricarboxylate transporter substrate-binding protein [Beijerinckiaceae bacterium]
MNRNIKKGLFGAAIALLAMTAQGHAQSSVEQFYKGRNLTIVLGHPPGGSYDFYARMAAEFMRKYIPGNPNIIIENRPGGAGVVAAAFFYAQSPRDGTVISLFPETLVHTQILEPEIGRWKVQEMSYIGSFAPVNTGFVLRKGAPAKTIEEMKQKQLIVGCSGVNSQSYQYPALLKVLGGFDFKMVCGYKGSAEYIHAMEQGEVDLVSSAWNSWRVTHTAPIASGELIPVLQAGLRRNKELPNVPLMQEVVSDPKAKRIIEFASAGAAIGRALLAPPQIPADRLAALRDAFDKTVRDKEFLETAQKRKLEIDPTSGAEVQKIANDILNTPPDIVEGAKTSMK